MREVSWHEARMSEVSWQEARRRSIRWARHYARHPDEAEDIAQEALLRAWRHRHGLRQRERFFEWLGQIVRNEAARTAARPCADPISPTELELAVDDERVGDAASRADLARSLRLLEERDQVLLRLRYEDDLTQAAIAKRLGMPEGTVKVRLHRARTKLHRALSDA